MTSIPASQLTLAGDLAPELRHASDEEPLPVEAASADLLADGALPGPDAWTDALTGTHGPRFWDDILAHEQARIRRYRSTACVALVDLIGFEASAAWLGREVAVGHFVRASRVLAREVRTSDWVARIDRHRFGILLVQADEILAINFVDRLRAACTFERATQHLDFRIHIGWASPAPGQTLDDAIATATQRLGEDPGA